MDTAWAMEAAGNGLYAVQRYAVLEDGGITVQDHGWDGKRYTQAQAQQVLDWLAAGIIT